jgi:ABC-type polysaccharide/polyol phosphate transport system ATPase subunit
MAAGNSVEVAHLSKSYPLYRSGAQRLAEMLVVQSLSFHEDFWALQDVDFTVARGESFGIVGVNGSGKSTLLQILAGILQPTRGSVKTAGRISALLELGSGFNNEFTGRENVYMNAAILGMSRREITGQLPAIEDFAEIGDFMDQPVKTYSTGMSMRLAFAVAIHVDPDILIIDEAIAVGDVYFRQRCMRKIHQIRDLGKTVLFVSHSPTDIKAFCNRCLWLDRGRVAGLGDVDAVLARYLAFTTMKGAIAPAAPANSRSTTRGSEVLVKPIGAHGYRYGSKRGHVIGAMVLNQWNAEVSEANPGTSLKIRVSVVAEQTIPMPLVGFLLRNSKGETIFGTNTTRDGVVLDALPAGTAISCDFAFTLPELYPGEYHISVALSEGTLDDFDVCDYIEDCLVLGVEGNPADVRGYLRLSCQTSVSGPGSLESPNP